MYVGFSAAVTPVKYESAIQYVTNVLTAMKNRETTEEMKFV